MATFSTRLNHIAAYVDIIMDLWETGYGTIGWQASVNITSGTRTGTWAWNAYVDGTYVGGGEFSPNSWSGVHVIGSGTMAVGHDANGNKNVSCSAYLDDYYATATASGSINMTRIPEAPTGITRTVDTILATSARFGTEITGYGHGSSAACRFYYKKTNAGSDSQTSDQNDVGGYNYFTIGSLVSNTNYIAYPKWWNNYGDVSDGATISILTLPSGSLGTPTNVMATTATIPATVALGDTSAAVPTCKLQYRKTGDSTWIDTATQQTASPSFSLSGLIPSTTYQFQLVVTNATGSTTTAISTLTTLPAAKVVLANGTVLNAIPRIVYSNGTVIMAKVNIIRI